MGFACSQGHDTHQALSGNCSEWFLFILQHVNQSKFYGLWSPCLLRLRALISSHPHAGQCPSQWASYSHLQSND